MIDQRVLRLIIVSLFAAMTTGCGVVMDITHRVVIDQVAYNEPADSMLTGARDRVLAGSAWRDYRANNAEMDFSHHFECGFKQGYVDHLSVGATEPPAIPPRKYWKVTYQTEEGHEAIRDWFDGYRFGVTAATESGMRQLVTIPLSIPPEAMAPDKRGPELYPSSPAEDLHPVPMPPNTWIPAPTEQTIEPGAFNPEPMPPSVLILPEWKPAQSNWKDAQTKSDRE